MRPAIVSEFMCPCKDNCGKALEVCECGDAAGYVRELADLQSAGLSTQAIREKFVEKYGPTVLAAPPASGFGMTAYVAPPALILLGVIFVIWIVRKRKSRPDAPAAVTAADLKKAEEALKRWK